ncbi:hypothetical protein [Kitasatospora sp. NPDC056184]|uniref:hypothetical protein n=1 Tax=Kitasatospora sp. NPDC056184 TaxID=3345738 RepID=UPI0035D79B83
MTTTGALAPDGATRPDDPDDPDDPNRPERAALPATYLLWLAGAQLGALGDAALAFALGWAAAAHGGGAAGLVLTAITVSRTALVVAGLLARRGGGVRGGGGTGAALGLCAVAAGIALLAAAPGPGTAVAGGVVTGAGSGLFACRIGPLVMGAAPDGHLSRVQALLTLVQSAALVLSTGLLGLLADAASPRVPMALCAAATGAAGTLALVSPVLRRGGVLAGRAGGGQSARAGRGRTDTAGAPRCGGAGGASGGGDE